MQGQLSETDWTSVTATDWAAEWGHEDTQRHNIEETKNVR